MAKTTDGVSIREVYSLIQSTKNELKSDIRDVSAEVEKLRASFDNLEAGRLSAVEKEVANIQGRMIMSAGFITIVVNGFFLIVNFLLKQ